MIEVKARSGHVLRVADEAAADHWVSLGYQRVEDEPEQAKPARKTAAKKSSSKSAK